MPRPPISPTQNGFRDSALLTMRAWADAVRPGTGRKRVAVPARFARKTPR
jgi:hypothetical protein